MRGGILEQWGLGVAGVRGLLSFPPPLASGSRTSLANRADQWLSVAGTQASARTGLDREEPPPVRARARGHSPATPASSGPPSALPGSVSGRTPLQDPAPALSARLPPLTMTLTPTFTLLQIHLYPLPPTLSSKHEHK